MVVWKQNNIGMDSQLKHLEWFTSWKQTTANETPPENQTKSSEVEWVGWCGFYNSVLESIPTVMNGRRRHELCSNGPFFGNSKCSRSSLIALRRTLVFVHYPFGWRTKIKRFYNSALVVTLFTLKCWLLEIQIWKYQLGLRI